VIEKRTNSVFSVWIVNRIEKIPHFVRKQIQKRGRKRKKKKNREKLVDDHDVTDKLKSGRFGGRHTLDPSYGREICQMYDDEEDDEDDEDGSKE